MKNMFTVLFIISFSVGILISQGDNKKLLNQPSFDCKTCHACEKPTEKNPCLRDCPRFELMTVHHSPDEAPDVMVIDVLTNLYVPVMFSHKLHAQMADMSGGCQICHHYNPQGEIQECRECHPLSPQRADLSKPSLKGAYHRQCLSCHREWSHTTKCAVCHALKSVLAADSGARDTTDIIGSTHPTITEPKKIVYETKSDKGTLVTFFHDEHIHLFGFKCVNCHEKENCSKCHDLAKPTLVEQIQAGKPLKIHKTEKAHHQDCFMCHSNDKCIHCHSKGEKKPFNHLTRTGWKLNPYHIKLSCQHCHQDMKKIGRLNKNCHTCHPGWNVENFNHAITGLILDENHLENDCEECHVGRNYINTPACENCHDEDIAYPAQKPGKKVQ